MSLTADAANELLDAVENIDDLRELIDDLDIIGEGNVTLLYSGGNTRDIAASLGLVSSDLRLIGSTEAAQFLSDNDELNGILVREFGDDPDVRGSRANQFLFGTIDEGGNRVPNGAWDNVC
jgi:hypothetical protein